MERLELQCNSVFKALESLRKGIERANKYKDTEEFDSFNDSVIKRNDFCIELVWKLLRLILQQSLEIAAPLESSREVLREALNLKLITEDEYAKLLLCLRDRNMASHTYDEDIAKYIVERIPGHYEVMKTIVDRLHSKIVSGEYS